MPLIQKTAYIREEDVDLWDNLPNRALFIHNALHNSDVMGKEEFKQMVPKPTTTKTEISDENAIKHARDKHTKTFPKDPTYEPPEPMA